MGALKAWIYAPVFRFFGVSALTIRLPAILLAAVTLLIFFQTLRAKLGAVWATIPVWIMAVDPVNLFPSRLDWGPTANGLAPANLSESAIARTLPPGAYTVIVRGKDPIPGIGLVEPYDLSPLSNSKLGNTSTRGSVGTQDNILISGFIV